MKLRSILPVVCGLAGTGLLAASAMPRPQLPSIEPSSGGIVARLGARPFLHEGRVRSVAFLDGSRRVVSVDDRAVTVWGVHDGALQFRRTLQPATQRIRTASVTPNGQVIALAAGKDLSIIDAQHSSEIRALGRESADVTTVAISADGKWVAGGAGTQVSIWDAVAGTVTRRLTVTGRSVGAIAFSPDGHRLATSAGYWPSSSPGSSAIQLWSLDDGQELRRWEAIAHSLAFAPDGRTLAGSTETPTRNGSRAALKLYDTSGGAERWEVGGTFNHVAFSADGSRLVAGGLEEARVIDAASGKEIRTVRYNGGLHVYGVAFSPDGTVLATGGDDNRVRLWRTTDWTRLDSGEGHDGPAQVVAFSPDGRLLASGGGDGTVRLWSWPSGRPARIFEGVGTHWGIKTLRFSDDGQWLAAAASGPTAVAVWDVPSGIQIGRLPSGHPAAGALPIAFRSDRNRLLTVKDGAIVEWDVLNAQTRVIGRPIGYVSDLALAVDGRHLAYTGHPSPAAYSTEVGVMDVATGQTVRVAQEDNDLTGSPLLAAPDGSWAMIRNHAWDPTTGQVLPFGRKFEADYRRAAVSPNGRLIYKSVGGGIAVWERLTARDIHTIDTNAIAVAGVAVSPDGRILAAACHDGSIVMIDISAATAGGAPAAPRTTSEFEDLWRVMGDADHWAANVAVWSFAKAGAPAVDFLTSKLAPALPFANTRLAGRLRLELSAADGLARMTAARALLDHGLAFDPEDIAALRSAEEAVARSTRGGYGGLSASGRGRMSAMPARLEDLDTISPLPERLRSARAIAALGYSTAPRDARMLLESLATGYAGDPQTVDAVSALGFLGKH